MGGMRGSSPVRSCVLLRMRRLVLLLSQHPLSLCLMPSFSHLWCCPPPPHPSTKPPNHPFSEELRALEDEKIGASAFDDVEGLDDEEDANAVWNWALDETAAAEDDSAAQAASECGGTAGGSLFEGE